MLRRILASFAAADLQMHIIYVLPKAARSVARSATSSLCPYAAGIIARFTNAAKKSGGGKIWVSMP
jgi:hypothetical protein